MVYLACRWLGPLPADCGAGARALGNCGARATASRLMQLHPEVADTVTRALYVGTLHAARALLRLSIDELRWRVALAAVPRVHGLQARITAEGHCAS